MPSGHLPMKSETTKIQNKVELPGGRQDSRIAESEPASVQTSIKAVTILAKLSKSTFWELCKLAKGLQPSEESLFQKKEKLLNLGKKTRDWDILTWVNPVYLLLQLHSISLESYQPCSHQRDRWALELLPKPSAQTTVTVWPDSQLPERATFTGCCVFDLLGAERHRKGPVSRALMETISFHHLTFCLTNNAILIGAHKSLAKIHIRKVWGNEACIKCFEKFWPITGAPKNGTLVEGCSLGWGEPERAPITLFWLALKPYKSRK